jgi:hypothetical protein
MGHMTGRKISRKQTRHRIFLEKRRMNRKEYI